MHLLQEINTLKIKLNLSKPTHKFFNIFKKIYNPRHHTIVETWERGTKRDTCKFVEHRMSSIPK